MSHKFLLYIAFLFSIVTSSCTDELRFMEEGKDYSEPSSYLSLQVDIPEVRTRTIDMAPGAPIYLNKIWVGIYRVSDGQRVGGTPIGNEANLANRMTSSGSKLVNVVNIEGYENEINSTDEDLVVVGVANFTDSIIAHYYEFNNSGERVRKKGTLITALRGAKTWKDFIDIAVDAEESIFANQTPMLMGYLYKETTGNTSSDSSESDDYTYTKVNQFKSGDGVNLYPFGIDNNYKTSDIFVKPSNTGELEAVKSTGFVLKLRRMRAKMNINIETRDEDMMVTNVRYKVINAPKTAYLAQRRTNVFDHYDYKKREGFTEDVKKNDYSANSVDVENDGYISNEGENGGWQVPTDNKHFSFEHFENKHWSKKSFDFNDQDFNNDAYQNYLVEHYHDREIKNTDGSFAALTSSLTATEAWNNNASYFVLQMSIRDMKSGRNANIEYTVHEGFCNDKDGLSLVDKETGLTKTNKSISGMKDAVRRRLEDFSCIRNTDYYYNIKINSVEDIVLTVTKNNPHPTDQNNGKVYEMTYAKSANGANQVQNENAESRSKEFNFVDDENKPIPFEDLSFRLIGKAFDNAIGEYMPVDLCYNFSYGELNGFAGLWPAPVPSLTEYFVDTYIGTEEEEKRVSAYETLKSYFPDDGTHPHPLAEDMMQQIKIKVGSSSLTIKEFVDLFNTNQNQTVAGFDFRGLAYYEVENSVDNIRNELRGLYIFDKQRAIETGSRIQKDNDGCSYYRIYAAEQYPKYLL